MPRFTVTIRHGHPRHRYHTSVVEAPDLAAAMRAAAEALPDEVREAADLAEIRGAPEPEERTYLGDE